MWLGWLPAIPKSVRFRCVRRRRTRRLSRRRGVVGLIGQYYWGLDVESWRGWPWAFGLANSLGAGVGYIRVLFMVSFMTEDFVKIAFVDPFPASSASHEVLLVFGFGCIVVGLAHNEFFSQEITVHSYHVSLRWYAVRNPSDARCHVGVFAPGHSGNMSSFWRHHSERFDMVHVSPSGA